MNRLQKGTVTAYRSRPVDCGPARFEVLGAPADRALIRALAGKLADGSLAALTSRDMLDKAVAGRAPVNGCIVAALLASPLVGAELDLHRPFVSPLRGGQGRAS